jgi:FkbM family methyltransferase
VSETTRGNLRGKIKLIRRILTFLRLVSFLVRYPSTKVVGGPAFLSVLGRRWESMPSGLYSQSGQDAFVLSKFFSRIMRPGFPAVFLDVGCNHPVKHSNSMFFETHMGFRVIAVDALPTHRQSWAELRPRAEFILTAVGEREGTLDFEEIVADGSQDDMFSSIRGASRKAPRANRQVRAVSVEPLTKLLLERGIDDVGIMSLDIEGYEMQALLGLDLTRVKVDILLIENNSDNVLGDDRIRSRMIACGYGFFARIWGMDDVFVRVG